MKNEQIAEAIFAALEQLMQEAGPEWTLEFINAGLAESGNGRASPPSGNRKQVTNVLASEGAR